MSKLLINEPALQVLPSLAVKIGLNEAIILQQVHYWISNPAMDFTHNGRKWIYNSAEQWQKQFPFFSINTCRRALSNLKEFGLIEAEKLKKSKGDHTLYYTINYEQLTELECEKSSFTQNGQMPKMGKSELPKMGKSSFTQNGQISIKTTTETTTENIVRDKSRIAPPIKRHNLDANFLASQYGLNKQIADDWLTIRKAKRSPLTQTALNAVEREAGKAGISVAEAIEFSCEAGWVGFKADWYENRKLSNNNNDYRTAKSSIDRLNDTGWASTNAQPSEPVEVQTTGNLIESTDWYDQ